MIYKLLFEFLYHYLENMICLKKLLHYYKYRFFFIKVDSFFPTEEKDLLLDNFKICIAGHPEGAPNISDKQLQDAMFAKINYAERIITQWTLNIDAINKFVKTAKLPTHVGLLGPTSIKSLLKFANLVGSKNSLEFIKNNITKIPTLIKKQEPKNIIDKLDSRIDSIHFYTFGGIAKTSQWIENYFKKTVSKNQPY